MSAERPCIHEGTWAVYERMHDEDDQWEFLDTHYSRDGEDPGTAARCVCASKWTSGKHFILAVGTQGAYEYEITLETKGPVV